MTVLSSAARPAVPNQVEPVMFMSEAQLPNAAG